MSTYIKLSVANFGTFNIRRIFNYAHQIGFAHIFIVTTFHTRIELLQINLRWVIKQTHV